MIPFGNSGAAQVMMAYVEAISKAVMLVGALGAVHYKEKNKNKGRIMYNIFRKFKHTRKLS